jgi:hypothetical protein
MHIMSSNACINKILYLKKKKFDESFHCNVHAHISISKLHNSYVSGNSLLLARKLGGICSGGYMLNHWLFHGIFSMFVCLMKRMTHLCRRLGVLEGMGGCPIAISFLMMTHTSNFVVLCTGN